MRGDPLAARRGIPRGRALTLRQRQVAARAADGQSNKEIGFALGLSASTVATHLASALDKLGIRTRAELARAGPLLDLEQHFAGVQR